MIKPMTHTTCLSLGLTVILLGIIGVIASSSAVFIVAGILWLLMASWWVLDVYR